MNKKTQQFGVSLIELMIVIGIIGILTMWVGPAWRGAMQRDALATTTNNFIQAVRDTRMEAKERAAGARLVAKGAAGSENWAEGWRIVDINNNIIRDYPAPHSTIDLDADGGEIILSFNRDGYREATGKTEFTVCDSTESGEKGRQITLSALGQIKITKSDYTCP